MKLSTYLASLPADSSPDPTNDALYVLTAGGPKQGALGTLTGAPETVTTAGGIAAAGTNQATATVLTKKRNVITSAPPGTAVRLTFVAVGQPQIVVARAGADFLVYPPIGGTIEATGVNNPVTIPDGSSIEFFPESTTEWRAR